jgi:hypothetical protein
MDRGYVETATETARISVRCATGHTSVHVYCVLSGKSMLNCTLLYAACQMRIECDMPSAG